MLEKEGSYNKKDKLPNIENEGVYILILKCKKTSKQFKLRKERNLKIR